MMSCLVAGVVILQQEWIFQCKQLGSIVDTEPFLFQHPDLLDDGRMRSLDCRSRGQPRLLAGLHFYMTGGFDSQAGIHIYIGFPPPPQKKKFMLYSVFKANCP